MEDKKELNEKWMGILQKDERYIQWMSNLKAQSTKDAYTKFMMIFCQCIDRTPSQVISETITEIKAGLLPAERKTTTYLSRFKICMSERGFADKTYQVGLACIRSFFKSFDIPIPNILETAKAEPREENKCFIKREDVNNMVMNAPNLREKAIFLLMATSGLAIKEITNLKIGNITFDDQGVGMIEMRRQKSKTDFITFCTPEATVAIKSYWEERKRQIKEAALLKPDKKDKIINLSGLELNNNNYAFVTYSGNSVGEQLDVIVMSKLFRVLGNHLGYGQDNGFIKTRSHALRKFFASTLEDNGFPKPKIDYCLGHAISGTDAAYFKRNTDALKKVYIDHMKCLSIEKEITFRSLNTEDARKLQELEITNKEDSNRLKELENQVKSLKFENDELKNTVRIVDDSSPILSKLAAEVEELRSQNAMLIQDNNDRASLEDQMDTMKEQMKAMQDFIAKLDPNKLKPSKA